MEEMNAKLAEMKAKLGEGASTAPGPQGQVSPPVAAVLKFFKYEHLPPHLQAVSKPFADLAFHVAGLASNAETTVALRKLLEAKDAAVRSVLP